MSKKTRDNALKTALSVLKNVRGLYDVVQERSGVLWIHTQQRHLLDIFVTLCASPLKVNIFLDLCAMSRSSDKEKLLYMVSSCQQALCFCVTFSYNGEPIPSLTKHFKNAKALEKEVFEKHNIPFLDIWDRPILHVPQKWKPTVAESFCYILWPRLYQPDMMVMYGVKMANDIHYAYMQSGFLHRNIENKVQTSNMPQALIHMRRSDQQAGLFQEYSYVRALEMMMGISVAERAQWIRLILSEIVRKMAHIRTLTFIAVSARFLTVFSRFSKIFQAFQKLMCVILGPTLSSYTWIPGGVRCDLNEEALQAIMQWAALAKKYAQFLEKWCVSKHAFRLRTNGLGILGSQEALSFGCTGPVLRACSFAYDARIDASYDAYHKLSIKHQTAVGGCAFARSTALLSEVYQSYDLLQNAVRLIKESPNQLCSEEAFLPMNPQKVWSDVTSMMRYIYAQSKGLEGYGTVYSRLEGPFGEKGMMLGLKGHMCTLSKMRPSTLPNMLAFESLSRGVSQEDIELLLASLMLCPTEIDR